MRSLLKISFIAFFFVSCQSNNQISTLPPTVIALPTATVLPLVQARENEITSIWENSPHAQTSQAVVCSDCHLTENGVVLKEVSWRNQQTGQYQVVTNTSALCGNCHEGISSVGSHLSFSCTECHDPHEAIASCTDSGCHSTIPTTFFELPATPTGGHPASGSGFCGGTNCHAVATAVASTAGFIHGAEHALVSCDACHDASQMRVDPSPDDGRWWTWRKVETSGQVFNESGTSHNIQREVDCARCHFENNPWGLNPVIGDELLK